MVSRSFLGACDPGPLEEGHPRELTVQDLALLSDHQGSSDTLLAAASSIASASLLIAFAILVFDGTTQQCLLSPNIRCLSTSFTETTSRPRCSYKNSSSHSYTFVATRLTEQLGCASSLLASCPLLSTYPLPLASS